MGRSEERTQQQNHNNKQKKQFLDVKSQNFDGKSEEEALHKHSTALSGVEGDDWEGGHSSDQTWDG